LITQENFYALSTLEPIRKHTRTLQQEQQRR